MSGDTANDHPVESSVVNLRVWYTFYILTVFLYVFTAAGDAKSYIIISQLPHDVYGRFVEDKSSAHMSGLTFVVIGIVHLAAGRIAEGVGDSWINFLHQLYL